ncbi:MAG: dienelactone hydrolase family protein [Pseudomonadota bacterium]|nr:dienelactone hydrolase family protein [Pseudomonadota bacterium]MDP1903543.1 dienelactone hydrolase family protein [Pseudomonadota bacterium]MDP2351420.1 dienelactone hydrolase family protein [Pseudomonadota bacterium]
MNDATDNLQADYDSLVPPPLAHSRRGFLVTALGAGFALAAQPVMAQTAVTTSSEGLTAGEISVPTADGAMPAYRAQPAEGKDFPVILVVQEIFGVHEHIKDVCRRLAKLGYLAIAPELYARQGDPRLYSAIPEIIAKVVSKVPDAQVLSDLDACVAWAQANGGDSARLGITGFCWGGRTTWLYAAHNPKVKAGVAWYGRLVGAASDLTPKQPLDLASALHAPVLGLYGGLDQGIPQDTVDKMNKALAESNNPASKTSNIHVYPNAPHAFNADYRASYRKEEAEDGWKRMQAWFRQNGV